MSRERYLAPRKNRVLLIFNVLPGLSVVISCAWLTVLFLWIEMPEGSKCGPWDRNVGKYVSIYGAADANRI